MRLPESLRLALDSIWAHKLRSVLTLPGLITGIMSVVVVISIIQGFNAYIGEKTAGIGSKDFSVYLSTMAVIVAVTVSGLLGICSGPFPAWKAARLDPIDALRSE